MIANPYRLPTEDKYEADHYESFLIAETAQYKGWALTEQNKIYIARRVEDARREFLSRTIGYVEDGPVRLSVDMNGVLDISAPIIHWVVKERMDRRAAKEMEEKEIEYQASLIKQRRQYKNMMKKLGKFELKHYESLPWSTKYVWESLNEYQRFEILKQVDYDFRHRLTI